MPRVTDPAPTTTALAYFITFRCYGTWLHGDARGSTNRWHNTYSTEPLAPGPRLEARERALLTTPPFALDTRRRAIVAAAVQSECRHYSWPLHALNVRTNHVHIVLAAPPKPEQVLNMLKAAATRSLRDAGLIDDGARPWSRHGSTVYLWDEAAIADASEYVLFGQGDPLDDPS